MKTEKSAASSQEIVTQPLLSVLVYSCADATSYALTLDSILAQQTSFAFEVLVLTNSLHLASMAVAEKYATVFSTQVSLFATDVDEEAQRSAEIIGTMARGKYVAICRAGDEWHIRSKLQQQVTFLEQHNCCAACFHRGVHISRSVFSLRRSTPSLFAGNGLIGFMDILHLKNTESIPVSSIVGRRQIMQQLPSWCFMKRSLGFALALSVSEHHMVGYLDEEMVKVAISSLRSEPAARFAKRFDEIKYLMALWHIVDFKRIGMLRSVLRSHVNSLFADMGRHRYADREEILKHAGDKLPEMLEYLHCTKRIQFNCMLHLPRVYDVILYSCCWGTLRFRKCINPTLGVTLHLLFRHIQSRQLFIFGSGDGGGSLSMLLRDQGFPVHGFVDNHQEKWGRVIHGFPVLAPDSVPRDGFIIIASQWHEEIAKQLQSMGRRPYHDYLTIPSTIIPQVVSCYC